MSSMADYKNNNHGKDKNNINMIKKNLPSIFNRSMTINYSSFSSSSSSPSSSAAAAGGESTKKPLYNLYNNITNPTFQRNGSIKNLYNSSAFGSMVSATHSFKGKVKKLCSIFEYSPKHTSSTSPATSSSNLAPKNVPSQVPDTTLRLPGTEDRVVIYFTSLRGIRRTFQDCHSVRMIFRGFRIYLDERDVSMDFAYRKEIQKVLRAENNNIVSLPQIFIRGKYIGGADVIKQMFEVGELARMLKGLPLCTTPCEACDDIRFFPCMHCYGSRKVFDEDEDQPRRCIECNENGLVRCPLCCS